jgi:hypothetical protein
MREPVKELTVRQALNIPSPGSESGGIACLGCALQRQFTAVGEMSPITVG